MMLQCPRRPPFGKPEISVCRDHGTLMMMVVDQRRDLTLPIRSSGKIQSTVSQLYITPPYQHTLILVAQLNSLNISAASQRF